MTRTLTITQTERQLLLQAEQGAEAMVQRVQAWSKINSGSHNREGLDAMRAAIAKALAGFPAAPYEQALGVGEHIEPDGERREVNYAPALRLDVRPEAPVQIVLTGHYDTVFPKASAFQTPTLIDADTLNGPGVADMKGGIIVMIEALRLLEQHPDAARLGYKVLLSPDEEIGSPGSAPILATLGTQCHMGLTFEPALADGSLAGARKGSGNFAIIFRGRAAHAGRDHHIGRNAIAAAARLIAALDALNGLREGVTFNIAKVDGGGANNIVPDLAIARFNVRMANLSDLPWIQGELDTLIAHANAQDGITAELTGVFSRPPKPMAPANAQVFDWVKQAGNALGLPISWAPSGGVCEGNNLWASGCPNVDTLGVRGGEIHSEREFVKLSSFAERTKLAGLILMKLASGEFDAAQVKAMALENLHAAHESLDQKC